MNWHTENGIVCWNEGAVYVFSQAEIERVRQAAREVHGLYLEALAHVVRYGWWGRLGIAEADVPLLQDSWERQEWSLHGRFDFLLDEAGQPRLLEYNADTPLSLVETALAQRNWQWEVMPEAGQFNQLHECLVAAWRCSGMARVHCIWHPGVSEEAGTMKFMAGVVREAGLTATLMAIHRLGWDTRGRRFVDHDGEEVRGCYKIYPWEWMLGERFARHVGASGCAFVEPPWRLLLNSKGMLSVLWELFPDHPALLPCFEDGSRLDATCARKPFFGREGNNVAMMEKGRVLAERHGDYANQRMVHQAWVQSPRHDGYMAQLGVWMVGDEPAALGIRESGDAIITGDSAFVPHVVEGLSNLSPTAGIA